MTILQCLGNTLNWTCRYAAPCRCCMWYSLSLCGSKHSAKNDTVLWFLLMVLYLMSHNGCITTYFTNTSIQCQIMRIGMTRVILNVCFHWPLLTSTNAFALLLLNPCTSHIFSDALKSTIQCITQLSRALESCGMSGSMGLLFEEASHLNPKIREIINTCHSGNA